MKSEDNMDKPTLFRQVVKKEKDGDWFDPWFRAKMKDLLKTAEQSPKSFLGSSAVLPEGFIGT